MSNSSLFSFPQMLLPVDRQVDFSKAGDACKILNSVSALCGLGAEALNQIKTKKLSSYDSLATDCACHLRALRIGAIAQLFFSPHSTFARQVDVVIGELMVKQILFSKAATDLIRWCEKGKKEEGPLTLTPLIKALIEKKQQTHSSSYEFKLQDILNDMNGNIFIGSEIAFLIDAYLLTLVKTYNTMSEHKGKAILCAEKACSKPIAVLKEVTVTKQLTKKALEVSQPSLHVQLLEKEVSGAAKDQSTKQAPKVSQPSLHVQLLEREVYWAAKKQLADLGIHFLLLETAKFPTEHTLKFLQQNQKLVEGKSELPDFYSLTGVFQACLQMQLPVLLKVKKCLHSHRYQEPKTPFDFGLYLVPDKGKFRPAFCPKKDPHTPVIILEAKRSGHFIQEESSAAYAQRLMDHFDFMHLCQLDGSQHKQYTSDADSLEQKPSEVIPLLQLPEYAEEAVRLDQLKKEAQQSGCAFHNQSKIILSHIYGDLIGDHMKDKLYASTAEAIGLQPEEA